MEQSASYSPLSKIAIVVGFVFITFLMLFYTAGLFLLLSLRTDEMETKMYDLENSVSQIREMVQTIQIESENTQVEERSLCIDSDVNEIPDDIYIKGTVTYIDPNGSETTTYDECTGSNLQVQEKWCYESPVGTGNYVYGSMVYDCPNGCLDGACRP